MLRFVSIYCCFDTYPECLEHEDKEGACKHEIECSRSFVEEPTEFINDNLAYSD